MPQATHARTNERDRLRSRPSSVSLEANAESAPVLFRFPTVAAAGAAAVTADPFQPAAIPPVVERSPAGVPTATVASMDSSLHSMAGEVEGARSNINVAQPQTIAAQPAAAPVPVRSWWDHWSSGVVLILLIIALVAASILALNDGSKSPSDQLAGQPLTAAIDEFDLSNITIPEIASGPLVDSAKQVDVAASTLSATGDSSQRLEPNSQGPAEHGSESLKLEEPGSESLKLAEQGLESRATMAPKSEVKPNAGFTLESPLELPSSPPQLGSSLEVTSSLGHVPQATLELPADSNVVADQGNSAPKNVLETTAAPLATLAKPVAAAPLPLFDPYKKTSSEADTTLGVEKPVTSLTSGSPSLTPSAEGANSQAASQPALTVPGASPTLYDGAANTASSVATSGPVDTNLPSFDTILASATAPSNLSLGSSPTSSIQGAVVPPVQTAFPAPVLGTTGGLGQPPYVSTATPDAPNPALLRAYQPYSQMTQASNGVPSNRYPAANGQAPASQQSSQSSVQPGGIGFTLGN